MKTSSHDYKPISCAAHERLELAVMRHIPLWLRYLDEDEQVLEMTVMPLDIQTRPSGEWMTLRFDDGSVGELRLDCLQRFEERPPPGDSGRS